MGIHRVYSESQHKDSLYYQGAAGFSDSSNIHWPLWPMVNHKVFGKLLCTDGNLSPVTLYYIIIDNVILLKLEKAFGRK